MNPVFRCHNQVRGQQETPLRIVNFFLSRWIFIIALAAVASPLGALAQGLGSIEGVASNTAGITVPDASVRLVGLSRLVQTDEDGRFAFDGVPAGAYVVDVTSQRWGRAIAQVTVAANETVEIAITILRQIDMEEVVVTAGPGALTRSGAVQPTDVVTHQALTEADGVSIGETLGNRPGISSTYFGPGASRPVIRGMGGNRVSMLQQGLAIADLSDISPDHAVTIEVLQSERIEIVRGPATLLYGSSAIGGVVNVLDNRVPNELPTRVISGTLTGRGGTVASERTGALKLRGAAGSFAWHASGLLRETGDYAIPEIHEEEHDEEEHDEEEHGDEEHGDGDGDDHDEDSGILANSAIHARNGSLGLSYVGTRGYIGASLSMFDSKYGVPGHEHGHEEEEEEEEEGATIDMLQRSIDIEGAWRFTSPLLHSLRVRLGSSDYTHDELEGGEVGTTFDNNTWEARIEADHSLSARSIGVLGVQATSREVSLIGAEAFLPATTIGRIAIFALERWKAGAINVQAGARYERAGLTPDDDTQKRTFNGLSLSGGINYEYTEQVAFALSASRSVKIPSASELYANGPHIATRAFEIGNADLSAETALSLDVSTHLHFDHVDATATLFINRFSDYIFQRNTTDMEDDLQVLRVDQADAMFRGFEAEVDIDLYHAGNRHLSLRMWSDYTIAELTNGDPLPRIPPLRLGSSLRYGDGPFRASVSLKRVMRQERIASSEEETAGYNLLRASASYKLFVHSTVHEFMLSATNLTNEEARKHTSFLKELAPLPGRDIRFTYRVYF